MFGGSDALWRDGETARRRDGETARRRDGETARRRDGETALRSHFVKFFFVKISSICVSLGHTNSTPLFKHASLRLPLICLFNVIGLFAYCTWPIVHRNNTHQMSFVLAENKSCGMWVNCEGKQVCLSCEREHGEKVRDYEVPDDIKRKCYNTSKTPDHAAKDPHES